MIFILIVGGIFMRNQLNIKKLIIPITLLLLIGTGYMGYSSFYSKYQRVAYIIVEPQDFISTITATGRVSSGTIVQVRAEITGVIEKIDIDAGDNFKKGETLLDIETTELDQNVEQAKVKLKTATNKRILIADKERVEAQEMLHQAELLLQQKKNTYQKKEQLFRQGAIAENEWELAKYDLELSTSKLRQAEIQLAALSPEGSVYIDAINGQEEAIIALDKARLQRDKAKIFALFDGTVLKKHVEAGEFVSQGKELLTIARNEKLHAVVSVDESFIPKLYIGQRVMVKPEAFQEAIIEGQIEKIAPSINPEAGTIDVEITLVNPPDYLKRELTVLVEIVSNTFKNTILMDKSYLVEDEISKVWLWKNGVIQLQEIVKGEDLGNRFIVAKGLEEGDILLAPGRYKEGMQLKIPEVGEQ